MKAFVASLMLVLALAAGLVPQYPVNSYDDQQPGDTLDLRGN